MTIDPAVAEQELLHVLSSIERSGSFCTHGTVSSPLFRLDVDGVGTLSFPLPPSQAEQLAKVAEPAPYGRGADTLVDTAVRRAWQIGPDRVHLPDETWAETLGRIVESVASGLGTSELPVEASLYKLLVYDEGSFFVAHRDTEKQDGMFATLVVVLPSLFEGGELVVRHLDDEVVMPLRSDRLAALPYAAFFADCAHELQPVIRGWRVALVYNLVRTGSPARTDTLSAPDLRSEIDATTALLQGWSEAWPRKIVLPLEHHYTLDGLCFAGLKNADRGMAYVVVEAARRAGCTVHLAMISISESGSAVEGDEYEDRWSRYEEEEEYDDEEDDVGEYQVLDVDERVEELDAWITPDDREVDLQALRLAKGELWPGDALDDDEPDEDAFHEATGNAGGSFERTYRRAALVLWPDAHTLEVLLPEGAGAPLPWLLEKAGTWDGAPRSALHEEILAGVERILSTWPPDTAWSAEARGRMVSLLVRIGEDDRLESFVRGWFPAHYTAHDHDALFAAVRRLGAPRGTRLASEVLETAIPRDMLRKPQSGVALLLGAVSELGPEATRPLARVAVDAFTEEALAAVPRWQRPPVEPTLLVDWTRALWAVDDPTLCERAVGILIGRFDRDALLVPAAAALADHADGRPGWQTLRAACVEHLHRRATAPLEAPNDLARPATWRCACEYCRSLRTFLADPVLREWSLRAAETHRKHVTEEAQRAGVDLDFATVKKGSPHTLVCTKNQRSYERRVVQRKSDIASLAVFGVRMRT